MLSTCPHCFEINDAQAGVTGRKVPKVGDISICAECAGSSRYVAISGETAVLEQLTTDEHNQVLREMPEMAKALAYIKEYRYAKTRKG